MNEQDLLPADDIRCIEDGDEFPILLVWTDPQPHGKTAIMLAGVYPMGVSEIAGHTIYEPGAGVDPAGVGFGECDIVDGGFFRGGWQAWLFLHADACREGYEQMLAAGAVPAKYPNGNPVEFVA